MDKQSNGRIVWTPERGWHDGPPARVALDERGRLVVSPFVRRALASELPAKELAR